MFSTDNTTGFTTADLALMNEALRALVDAGWDEKSASDRINNRWQPDGNTVASLTGVNGAAELTIEETVALDAIFTARTGKLPAHYDEAWTALANAIEETGSCEIPSHLTLSGRPELVQRSELRDA